MKQTRFGFAKESSAFGGARKPGRKGMRPLCNKRGVHLILKTRRNLFKESQTVLTTVSPMANKFGVKIYNLAIAFDHAHFLLKFPSRDAYRKFIRAITGLLAKKLGAKLFTQAPFTRLFTWQSEYWILKRYMEQNREETLGHRPYRERKRARGFACGPASSTPTRTESPA